MTVQHILYHIEKEESDRIQFIKLIFCVMVIFTHSYVSEIHFADSVVVLEKYAWLEIMKFILSKIIVKCAVPGFLLISAVLLYRKDFSWGENLKKKITTLVVPYLILNTFWIAFNYFIHEFKPLSMLFESQQSQISQWGIIEWTDAYLGMKEFPFVYPLWFLRDLFLLNLISKILKWVIDKFPKMWLIFIIIVLFLNNIRLLAFRQFADDVVFFSLGYYIVKYDLHFRDLDKINIRLAGLIYAILIVISYLTREMPVYHFFLTFSNIVGILFFARCSDYFIHRKYKNKLLWTAKYSFSIYLFHEMSLTSLRKIWFKIFSASIFFQEASYFILPLLIILFCIALSRIMEKFIPRFYGTLTGNRKSF